MFKDELLLKLDEVALGVRKARAQVFAERGIAPGQARVVATLIEYGDLSQADLGRVIDIAPPTVKKLVENLIGSGLVATRPSEDDRRIVIVSLTEAGRKLEKTLGQCSRKLCEIVVRGMSEPEIIMTALLLARINENLKTEFDGGSPGSNDGGEI
ncbi:MAG: MarR family winged helix-turn-helix transcriptional regulator [Pyrinomonadaceae bacterium]